MNETTTALFAPAPGVRTGVAARKTNSLTDYNIGLGYLRAFITLLVVAHHAVLAYHPFAHLRHAALTAPPRFWQAFPVVDSHRSAAFAWFVGFNDTFFMALMFFLSGLFVWPSLQRKGSARFLQGRFLRLGLPFLIAAALVSPLAYFPAYLQTQANPTLTGFWQQWRALGNWPTGPAWFLWVLLAFDCLAAALFALLPRWAEVLGNGLSVTLRRPWAFFWGLAAASAVAYVPMVMKFTSLHWISAGPFTVQTCRVFHYALYFLAGIIVGAQRLDRTCLAPAGALAQRWIAWSATALGCFAVGAAVVVLSMANPGRRGTWELIGGFSYVLSCAALCLASLTLFLRFANERTRIWDSLSRNAYGIYLGHYAFVTWAQYALLKLTAPALVKGCIVFLCAATLSWGTTIVLRRVPRVGSVL
jgi:peptidoglycan/LPS O-acetylase OafA/YrhL